MTVYLSSQKAIWCKQLDELPVGYELSQNYPNPFNPTTNIKFSIHEKFVSLKIYNTLGQEVATLLNEFKSAGTYQVDFNVETYQVECMYIHLLPVIINFQKCC